jgi:predicted flavoprotein YhiN
MENLASIMVIIQAGGHSWPRGGTESGLAALRQCTHTGRPLGSPEFTEALEKITVRRLAPQKGGRPGKPAADKKQQMLGFDP